VQPYGWFQWYCRFYLGRRSEDDARQIARGLQVMGPTGRFRTQLLNKILQHGATYDDVSVRCVHIYIYIRKRTYKDNNEGIIGLWFDWDVDNKFLVRILTFFFLRFCSVLL
jgi:hypothetical protein